MRKLPSYVNCKTNTEVCKWYLHPLCEERCPYAKDINGLGCGAMSVEDVKGLEFKLKQRKE